MLVATIYPRPERNVSVAFNITHPYFSELDEMVDSCPYFATRSPSCFLMIKSLPYTGVILFDFFISLMAQSNGKLK